ncbi:MAG: inositol phosphatase [Planctomycetota bacterium]|nr:MAG: inositol phosphatase [Planctomycetota bacterium]
MKDPEMAEVMAVARLAAERGGQAALSFFQGRFQVEQKADGSPVTEADQAADKAILKVLQDAFPEHAYFTEESGSLGRPGPWRWIVDPLDGTYPFTRGEDCWGPLVALQGPEGIVAGAFALPARRRLYWGAKGQGAWSDQGALQVSSVDKLSEATLSAGNFEALLREIPGFASCLQRAKRVRSHGDVAGFSQYLDGTADIWIEYGVELWDLAPFPILVQEAGGGYDDWQGGCNPATGKALVAHSKLLASMMAELKSN